MDTTTDQNKSPPEVKTEEPSASKTTKKKKKKKKTKISFEEYEAITNAIACHLRALEEEHAEASQAGGGMVVDEAINYWTWQKVSDWYLEQIEQDIGDSMEALESMRKKVNLVIRRLIDVDRILVTVGDVPKSKKEEGKTLLAVHPNYEIN
jgi:valyl-tRNA synthetase